MAHEHPRRRAVVAVARVVAVALAVGFAGLLLAPAPASAADLFPVDDWIGDGARKLKDVTFGAVSFGVEEIGGLIVNLIAALVDLLVPDSLVRQGMKAVRWLVSVPVFGDVPRSGGRVDLSFPHLGQLREALTWIGVTLLPLAIIVTVARGWFDPRLDADPPEQILLRIVGAGVLLALYDTVWYALTRLTGLITGAILSLPWVEQGTEQMLEFLLIGGGAGTAVASEFIVPLLMLFAAIAFLGVLLLKIGLTVLAAVLYASGGLVVGLSPSSIGRRLLTAWAIALASIAVIPVLWAIIFATASALTLDAASPSDAARAGAPRLISQLFLGAAALAAFWMALSVGKAALGSARSAISTLSGPGGGGSGGVRAPTAVAGAGGARAPAAASLQTFARNVRKPAIAVAGGLSGAGQLAGAAIGRRGGASPVSGAADAAARAAKRETRVQRADSGRSSERDKRAYPRPSSKGGSAAGPRTSRKGRQRRPATNGGHPVPPGSGPGSRSTPARGAGPARARNPASSSPPSRPSGGAQPRQAPTRPAHPGRAAGPAVSPSGNQGGGSKPQRAAAPRRRSKKRKS